MSDQIIRGVREGVKMTLLDKALMVSLLTVTYLFVLITFPYWIGKIIVYIIMNVNLKLPVDSDEVQYEE